jgi:hypothetical protein
MQLHVREQPPLFKRLAVDLPGGAQEFTLDEPYFPYQVYILRMWRDGTQTPWRAVLEHARTGERHAFVELADLFAFLEAEAGADPPMMVSLEDTGYWGKVN